MLFYYSYGLELVALPERAMIPQGDSHTIFCESDEPYEICKWSHVDMGKTCRVTSDEIDAKQGTECHGESHLLWDLTETRCGITILNAARSDIGEYKCTVGVLEPEVKFLTSSTKIDVSVPAIVTFQGNFAESYTQEIDVDTETVFECHITGGYPQPTIQAAIGYQKDHIDTDGVDQILDSIDEQVTPLEDGTFEVTKSFTFIAESKHCGQFVKCEAVQRDEEDNILFQEKDVMSRKINILSGPLPLESALQPFTFLEGDKNVKIDIIFVANPVPNNNEAIWHINPTGKPSTDSHVLHAGVTEENGKYAALTLNDTHDENHGIRASLIITNPTYEDLQNFYYLEVITPKGSQRYDFSLELRTPEDVKPGSGDHSEELGKTGTGEKTKGMGVGSVIAIVIVIAVISLIIGCVVYAKRTGKCCFEQYNSVPTKQPDVTQDNNGHTAIIKNGPKLETKPSKTVEAGVDETDENIPNNPV